MPNSISFRTIVEQTLDGIIVHQNSAVMFANVAAERIYGHDSGTMIGMDPFDLLVPGERERAKKLAQRRLLGERIPERLSFRGLRRDGSEIDVEMVGFTVEWDGAPAVAFSVNDVSDRNQAITERDETEQLLQRFLEHAPLPILMIIGGRYTFANLRARDLFQPKGRDLVGMKADALYQDPADRARALGTMRETGLLNGMDVPLRRWDGVVIPTSVYSVKTTFQGKEAFFATVIDQSERLAHEARSQRTEALLTAVMEHAPLGFAFRDPDGRFELINRENATQWQQPVEKIVGRRAADFAAPEAAQWCQIMDDEAIRVGKVERQATFAFDPKSGARRIRSIRFPVRDKSRSLLGVANFTLDITAEWQAQEALKVAEAEARQTAQMLRAIVDHAPIAITYRDSDRRVKMLNPIAEDWIGHSEAEAMDRQLEELPNYRPSDRTRQIDELVFEEQGTFDEDIMLEAAGGRTVPIRAIRFPVFARQGVLAGVCNIGLDQTQAHTYQELMAATLDAARLAIVRTDERGIIESFNPAAEEAFGYTADEVIGKDSFMLLDAEEALPHRRAVRDALIGGERHFLGRNIEFRAVRKDGTSFLAEVCVGEAIVDGARKYIGTMRDLSELRAAEQQLRQAQKMEAVGQLTGGIAHDFNNLIAVISGNLELLGESPGLDARQEQLIQSARRASDRGRDLTARLLSFARQRPVTMEVFDPYACATAALSMITRAIGQGIRLHLEGEAGLFVRSDPAQFETAILNLALNARDAMPEGGDIRIAVHPAAKAGEVVISVTDSGAGMPDDVRARAFEPFFTTKGVGKGSGLGLAMVYGFAQQSGGRAAIRNGEKAGTRVEMHLPCVDGQRAEGPSAALTMREGVEPATILVIDPDPDVRKVLTHALQDMGHEVMSFKEAERGLGFLKLTWNVDYLVLADELAATAAGKELRDWVALNRPEVRTVLLTPQETNGADKAPLDGHWTTRMPKPFSTSDLLSRFGSAAEGSRNVR
ncbi:PAS domain S-box protein [Minwuia sp. IMCC3060]|jgi:PAS domain S-box-containing protein|uniref:PAS domain S-box protein n=1 Tax=Minwuia sp. IMCC3060 TaxID=3040675 RepID=UPI00247A8DDA|nr:PAS domain S-box protein [Minwuia sp. IMCC3060]